MMPDNSRLALHNLRGTDSNSLLRLYDQVKRALGASGNQSERQRADKAVRRIALELQSRDIRL
jgi:hypothetical protein